MDAVPEKFDSALVTIGRKHAGAAELKKLQSAVTGNESADIEFARGVEPTIFLSKRLAQKPISADHGWPAQWGAVAHSVVDHEKVVAYCVIPVDIAPGEKPGWIGNCGTFLVEDPISKFLGLTHLRGGIGQAHFQRTYSAQRLRKPVCPDGRCTQSSVGLQ
jgi:hypothetical protein